MQTYNGVKYYEITLDGSPDEKTAQDATQLLRTLEIVPGDLYTRQAARDAFLGTNDVKSFVDVNGKQRVYLSRTVPLPYPTLKSIVNPDAEPVAYASSIVCGQGMGPGQPDKSNSAATSYPNYRYTLAHSSPLYRIQKDDDVVAQAPPTGGTASPLYSAPLGSQPSAIKSYPDEGDRLRSGTWTDNAGVTHSGGILASRFIEFRQQDGFAVRTFRQGAVYVKGGNQVVAPMPVRESFTALSFIWRFVPFSAYPANAVGKCENCVNECAFAGFPAGTMLFLGATPTPGRGPLGDWLFTAVEYRFKVVYAFDRVTGLPHGHNGFLMVVNGSLNYYDVVLGSNAGLPMFPSCDPASLFRPDQPS